MTKSTWMNTLEQQGYVVVPGVIPANACAQFRDDALSWLESFPYGFKRDDRSTWNEEHLPWGAK